MKTAKKKTAKAVKKRIPASRGPKAGLQKAAMAFAEAWASWHNHTDPMPDLGVIEAASGLLEALGVDMVDGEDGLVKLVREVPRPKPPKGAK